MSQRSLLPGRLNQEQTSLVAPSHDVLDKHTPCPTEPVITNQPARVNIKDGTYDGTVPGDV